MSSISAVRPAGECISNREALLQAATGNGMRALGWDAGELKAGRLADFVTLRAAGSLISTQATWSSASQARDVTNVVVGGRTVVSR